MFRVGIAYMLRISKRSNGTAKRFEIRSILNTFWHWQKGTHSWEKKLQPTCVSFCLEKVALALWKNTTRVVVKSLLGRQQQTKKHSHSGCLLNIFCWDPLGRIQDQDSLESLVIIPLRQPVLNYDNSRAILLGDPSRQLDEGGTSTFSTRSIWHCHC